MILYTLFVTFRNLIALCPYSVSLFVHLSRVFIYTYQQTDLHYFCFSDTPELSYKDVILSVLLSCCTKWHGDGMGNNDVDNSSVFLVPILLR